MGAKTKDRLDLVIEALEGAIKDSDNEATKKILQGQLDFIYFIIK